VGPRGNGAGTYEIKGDSIFIYQMTDNLNSEPYVLEGGFHISRVDTTLTMRQVLYPGGWSRTHNVVMTPGQIIFVTK